MPGFRRPSISESGTLAIDPGGTAFSHPDEGSRMTPQEIDAWLVRTLDMPFRDAHHVTGRLVAEAESRGCGLEDLPLEAMRQVEPRIGEAVYEVLGVENSVGSRNSFGGTARERVLEQVAWWRERV